MDVCVFDHICAYVLLGLQRDVTLDGSFWEHVHLPKFTNTYLDASGVLVSRLMLGVMDLSMGPIWGFPNFEGSVPYYGACMNNMS